MRFNIFLLNKNAKLIFKTEFLNEANALLKKLIARAQSEVDLYCSKGREVPNGFIHQRAFLPSEFSFKQKKDNYHLHLAKRFKISEEIEDYI